MKVKMVKMSDGVIYILITTFVWGHHTKDNYPAARKLIAGVNLSRPLSCMHLDQ
jgi:hypothetical protein